jgi:predicted RNase H-like HicB family nuclease
MPKQLKVIVEKHSDGYVAYPLGLKGVVIGEGDSYDAALADVRSAIKFHIDSFGAETEPFKGSDSVANWSVDRELGHLGWQLSLGNKGLDHRCARVQG